jgi:hypothetical protein
LENFNRIDFSFITCARCGHGVVIRYGTYRRKKAGISIQRFYCKKCVKYFNWLPPFLIAHKHYTLSEIESGIEAYVTGSVGYVKTFQKLELLGCCQETLWRWVKTLSGLAGELYKIARQSLAAFKPSFRFEKDKRLLACNFPAACLASQNHNLQLFFQLYILREYFTAIVAPEDFLVWLIFQKQTLANKSYPPTQFANDQPHLNRDNDSHPP